MITQPLKWHGGKHYLAPKIVALMPPHVHYVEPFFGGGAVLLAQSGEDRSELVNDINGDLINFWRVLQDEKSFARFQRQVEATPLSRTEWVNAGAILSMDDAFPEVVRAAAFFVRCRQSLAGRMKNFTPPTRTRLRRGMNGNVSEWLGAVDGLPAVHARLRRVFVENMNALTLIPREDSPGTLYYCDPPYLPETRTSPDAYAHEMTYEDHYRFLVAIKACVGKVMVSGYANPLYDTELVDWTRVEWNLPNNAAGGDAKRRMTEVLWCNFKPKVDREREAIERG